MTHLNCTKCNTVLPVEMFGKKNSTTRGYRYWCKPCGAAASKSYILENGYPKSKKVDKEKKRQWDATYRAKNAEKLKQRKKEYYEKNKDAFSIRAKKRYAADPDSVKIRVSQWKRDNPDKVNAACMKRYTGKMQARPKWLTEDELWMMEEAYSLAKLREEVVGGKWDVDHIVPLRGKKVCGLHVPWNLAVVPAAVNRSKGNKFDVF